MAASYIYVVLISICFVTADLNDDKQLKFCTWDSKNVTVNKDQCFEERLRVAAIRHNNMLVSRHLTLPLNLPCYLCEGDNPEEFDWMWINRSTKTRIFKYDAVAEEEYMLDLDLLDYVISDTTGKNLRNPCMDKMRYDLSFSAFDSKIHSGTYVCMNSQQISHPNNYIWYHVDIIEDPREIAERVELPILKKIPPQVQSKEEIEKYQNLIEGEMEKLEDFEDQDFHPIYMTSYLHRHVVEWKECGIITVYVLRDCYLVFKPNTNTYASMPYSELKFIYLTLRMAFDFLVLYRQATTPAEEQIMMDSSRYRAEELGFQLHVNQTHMAVPCQYSLLRQMPQGAKGFEPIKKSGLYVEINYDLKCPGIDAMSLVNLALQRDMARMKMEVLGFDDTRYMKVEKITTQGTIDFKLECFFNGSNACDQEPKPALWRDDEGIVYHRRSVFLERVYMDANCDLIIAKVTKEDEGVYQCFDRDRHDQRKWQKTAKISYRLKIQSESYALPTLMDFYIGIAVLTIWALCLTGSWAVMMMYDYHISASAMLIAAVRQRRLAQRDKETLLREKEGVADMYDSDEFSSSDEDEEDGEQDEGGERNRERGDT